MYDLGFVLVESRPFVVLDGLPGLYWLKYDSATACGLPLYLCSYKLVGSTTFSIEERPAGRPSRSDGLGRCREMGKERGDALCRLRQLHHE